MPNLTLHVKVQPKTLLISGIVFTWIDYFCEWSAIDLHFRGKGLHETLLFWLFMWMVWPKLDFSYNDQPQTLLFMRMVCFNSENNGHFNSPFNQSKFIPQVIMLVFPFLYLAVYWQWQNSMLTCPWPLQGKVGLHELNLAWTCNMCICKTSESQFQPIRKGFWSQSYNNVLWCTKQWIIKSLYIC